MYSPRPYVMAQLVSEARKPIPEKDASLVEGSLVAPCQVAVLEEDEDGLIVEEPSQGRMVVAYPSV